ncbi:MAG: hypothetical protein ACJ74B_11560 [Gaiellaceae bacterium]
MEVQVLSSDPDAFTPAGAGFILGSVLRFSKPPLSFVCFLLVVVAVGAATGYPFDALGLAAFCFFVASIEAKPSWKFWYDPPAKGDTGRASCAINSSQRVAATSPKEIRQLPEHRDFGKTTRRSF